MNSAEPLYRQSGRTRGRIFCPINLPFLCGSVSSLLITTAEFALYWLILKAMMTKTECRIGDEVSFNFDVVLSLLDVYACSSIPIKSVMFGDFLTP